MSKITIKNLATYQDLSQAASADIIGGAFGDAITGHYGFLNTQLGPYNPAAHQIGAAMGNYWADQLSYAANYGAPGAFSDVLYGQVIPSIFYSNW